MHFVIQYRTREENAARLKEHRASHREYRGALGSSVLLAGPMFGTEGDDPIGSLFIISAEDLEAATQIAVNDPLCSHEIYDLVSVTAFRPMTFNAPAT